MLDVVASGIANSMPYVVASEIANGMPYVVASEIANGMPVRGPDLGINHLAFAEKQESLKTRGKKSKSQTKRASWRTRSVGICRKTGKFENYRQKIKKPNEKSLLEDQIR
ncbi:hypothetical protein, partial [Aminicella lysinilytica]|uniref:hypothetical protein n=1 Tax=Aminicella lysinilytica TaxID=433323 RepID=UPI0026F2838C